ncbi:hypothetical protein DFJ74DRAFT_522841 [Hyaloraphidium curvatum]|nr:hypothetical protein DFJ74DRAFT_522841 [Hyaloraphidium curvatum]
MDVPGLPSAAAPQLHALVSRLRRRQLPEPFETAMYTLLLFQNVFNACKNLTGDQFLALVAAIDGVLARADPTNLVPGNICARLSHIIREEHEAHAADGEAGTASSSNNLALKVADFKVVVIDEIKELVEEIKAQDYDFGKQALHLVHSNEVILTLGYSRAVFQFLRAARSRRITVFVAENAPSLDGQKMVEHLQQASIDASLVTDSACFALMPRVHRVLIAANAISRVGGAIAPAGTLALAVLAAQRLVPVCVCAGSYQLSSQVPPEAESLGTFGDPTSVWPAGDSNVRVLNATCEYLAPEHIDLIITHASATTPANAIRQLSDLGLVG